MLGSHQALMLAANSSGVSGGGTPTTLNSADMHSDFSLSGGDLIVTCNVLGWGGVRSIASSSDAKWYCEAVLNNPVGNMSLGISAVSSSMDTHFIQVGTTAYSVNSQRVYSEGSEVVSGLPGNTGVARMAVDLSAREIWFGNASGWFNSGDPGAGSNPTYSNFPADTYFVGVHILTLNEYATLDFGQAPTYAVPSGFTSVT